MHTFQEEIGGGAPKGSMEKSLFTHQAGDPLDTEVRYGLYGHFLIRHQKKLVKDAYRIRARQLDRSGVREARTAAEPPSVYMGDQEPGASRFLMNDEVAQQHGSCSQPLEIPRKWQEPASRGPISLSGGQCKFDGLCTSWKEQAQGGSPKGRIFGRTNLNSFCALGTAFRGV